MQNGIREALMELLLQGREAHRAEVDVDPDPEWPIWLAGYLKPKLPPVLGCTPLTQSLLTKLLLDAESEHQAKTPEDPWQESFATLLIDRLAIAPQAELALYHFDSCPFCRRVRRALERLGIEDQVELRDIFDNLEYRDELMAARGRPTVPVLRCSSGEGAPHYLPESADIIRFLEDRFGQK